MILIKGPLIGTTKTLGTVSLGVNTLSGTSSHILRSKKNDTITIPVIFTGEPRLSTAETSVFLPPLPYRQPLREEDQKGQYPPVVDQREDRRVEKMTRGWGENLLDFF